MRAFRGIGKSDMLPLISGYVTVKENLKGGVWGCSAAVSQL